MYGLPATVSPTVRLYAAVTLSPARKPESVPVKAGAPPPYSFVAAFGVTFAAFGVIVKVAVV